MSDGMIKIAINGFGRIGRQALKLIAYREDCEVVAINDLTTPMVLAHLLKHDSNYGKFKGEISYTENSLVINGKVVPVYAITDPLQLPWESHKVDVVLECTGRFTDSEKASAHLKAGARRVVISAPAKDSGTTPTYLIGVNSDEYKGEEIISNASCTTNCITPVAHVLSKEFGVLKMMMTTIHSYTAEQNLVDGPPPGLKSSDLRRARAAGINMVPTSTGAAISATEVLPSLKSKFHGFSVRVPTSVGSLSDFVCLLEREVTIEEVNKVFKEASETYLKGVLEYSEEELVSTDIIGNSHSAIFDSKLTAVVGGNLLKIVVWYDNEFGYSNRLVEQAVLISK
jgi:glyceraldehyde 3-phosphate dehydrogenase